MSPGDDFDQRGPDWPAILEPHGWQQVRERDGLRYWRRAGKDGPCWSATMGVCSKAGRPLFCVFSTNAAPFPGPVGGRNCSTHGKFATYTLLNCGGDFSAAARELAEKGYGEQQAGHRQAPEPLENGKAAVPQVEDIHLTDLGNARRVVKRHGSDLRYVHPWKTWLVWDGKRWAEDVTGEVVRRVKDTLADLYRSVLARIKELGDDEEAVAEKNRLGKLVNHALKWEDARAITRSLELARSERGVPALPAQLDADPFLLNVLNGTIDLRTGQLRPHRREDLITKLAPVEYDEAATCPLWLKFLDRIMDSNKDLIGYLQRVVGHGLTGEVSEQCLWFFHGAGANGKSPFLGTVLAMLGDYGMQAVSELLMQKHHESHPTDRRRRRAGAAGSG